MYLCLFKLSLLHLIFFNLYIGLQFGILSRQLDIRNRLFLNLTLHPSNELLLLLQLLEQIFIDFLFFLDECSILLLEALDLCLVLFFIDYNLSLQTVYVLE